MAGSRERNETVSASSGHSGFMNKAAAGGGTEGEKKTHESHASFFLQVTLPGAE